MQLNVRQREIVMQLTELRTVTMETLISQYNISKRTIYSDLSIIREWLKFHNIKYEENSSIPYIDKSYTQTITNILYEKNPYLIAHSQRTRVNVSLSLILFSRDKIYSDDVFDAIGISRSTFYRDYDLLKSWFKQNNLTLNITKDKGLEILGSEKDYRNAMVSFINKSMMQIDVLSLLKLRNKSRIVFDFEQDFIYKRLEEYIDSNVLSLVLKQVSSLEKLQESELPINYRTTYIWFVIFSITRHMDGHDIEKTSSDRDSDAYDFIEKEFKEFDLNKNEISSLTNYLNHILIISRNKLPDNYLLDQKLVEFLRLMTLEMNFPFVKEEKLIQSLKKHVYTTNERIKNEITEINPLKDDIKERFEILFNKTKKVLYETELIGSRPTDDEVGYIVIYLASFISESNSSPRVYVVCTTGKGSAILLMSNLKKSYPQLDIIDLATVTEAMAFEDNHVDAVISTTQFHHESIPIITVTPLLNDTDIIRINDHFGFEGLLQSEPFESIQSGSSSSFFEYMSLMTDCVNTLKELEKIERVLSNDEFMSILIHLMIQLTQNTNNSELTIIPENLKNGTYYLLNGLYQKYDRYVSEYDLKSIELYFSKKYEN